MIPTEEYIRTMWLPPGWLHDTEAVKLFKICRDLPETSPVLVEIGSWLGKSSAVLGYSIADREDARVYCVDPWDGAGSPVYPEIMERNGVIKEDLFSMFRANMYAVGVEHVICPEKGTSADIAASWDTPIDFLFIDGDHKVAGVRQDLRLWSPFVKPGGYLALHDVYRSDMEHVKGYEPGPREAIESELDPEHWENSEVNYTLFSARRKL